MKRKPILCLDFDGVVHSYVSGWKGARVIPDPPTEGAMAFMQDALCAGWDVVIHSSRARYWGGITAMRNWLREWCPDGGWHEVMGTPQLEDVRFVRWKPPAIVTLDDRALTFMGTWPALEALREFKPWNKGGTLRPSERGELEQLREVIRETSQRVCPNPDCPHGRVEYFGPTRG